MDVSLSQKVKAHRFDFTLNDQYYVLNIKMLEEGKRIEASSSLQGRVVSKEGIMADPEMEHRIFYF